MCVLHKELHISKTNIRFHVQIDSVFLSLSGHARPVFNFLIDICNVPTKNSEQPTTKVRVDLYMKFLKYVSK